MFRRLGYTAAGVATSAVALKAAQITANDDWDLVKRRTKKFFMGGSSKQEDGQIKKKVVVLGSGWGAISFIQQLDLDQVDLTIVSPRSYFFYTPLLAGTATGTVAHTSIMEPIRWYCDSSSNAKFVQAECTSVDLKKKTIQCKGVNNRVGSFPVEYDHLVVACGAEPATFNIPGVKEHASFMKEVEDGINVKRQILQRLETASSLLASNADEELIKKELTWLVIGGGPTGVELTAEITDFIKQDVQKYFPDLVKYIRVILVEAFPRVLGMFEESMSNYATESLRKNGAEVMTNAMVTKVTKDVCDLKVKLTSAKDSKTEVKKIDYGALVWAGGIAMRPLTKSIANSIPGQNSRFGLVVDKKMNVKGVEDGSVWALGDAAVSGCAPTAQAANQQGKYLGKLFERTNLESIFVDKYPEFTFSNKGALAYVGSSRGIAELKNLWDIYPVNGQVKVEGAGAFAIWRSLYFSSLLSSRNRSQVAFDWMKGYMFGRDISTPAGKINTLDSK